MTSTRRLRCAFQSVALTLLICSCDGTANDGEEPDSSGLPVLDGLQDSEYYIKVTSPLGDREYQGTVTRWDPTIGHLSLGPESGVKHPVASLSFTASTSCFDGGTGVLDRTCSFILYSFYSIEAPGAVLGEQDSRNYEYLPGSGEIPDMKTGFYGPGLQYFNGSVSARFNRTPPVIGDWDPEEIKVEAVFYASEH